MREGWKIKKLGEVCDFQGGSQPPKDEWISEPREGYVRMLQIRDFTQKRSSDIEFVKKSNRLKYCQETDILLGRYGASVGKVLTGLAGAYNVAIIKTMPDETLIDRSFFKYFLLSPHFQDFLQHASKMRAAQAGFSKEDIQDYLVFVPPLSEQKRIVAELDLLSEVIAKKREQLTQLDALAQSLFYTMFGDPITNEKGWEKAPLKEAVIEMFLGPFGSALKTNCYVDEEKSYCMVYEQKHAIKKTLHLDNHFIDKEKFDELKRFEVHAGDFIMSCRGTIGEVYQLPDGAPQGIIHPSLMKIRIKKEKYNPAFFIRLLTQTIKLEETNGNCVQMAITAKELGKRKLILPPLALQQQFAEKIEAIEQQKERIRQSLAEVQLLFDSRMDYYFNEWAE